MLAGVCGGLGEYLGIQAVWVRVGFVLLALASFGWGVLAYVLMALAIPKSRLGEPYRSIPTDHEGTKLVGLALIALGGIFLFNLLVPIELALKFIAPLILIGVGLAIVMRRER